MVLIADVVCVCFNDSHIFILLAEGEDSKRQDEDTEEEGN